MKQKSTARLKKRYIQTDGSSEAVKHALLEYMGVSGWARAAPQLLPWKKGVVIAIRREMVDEVRAALEISSPAIRVLRVSGTLKGLH
ncbi:hypothetical protein HYZ97_02910 [Candidatus Pacearchaeota archaeon]|nr:hypothetical protein [Candidatus Pacearchaeota archaeon]